MIDFGVAPSEYDSLDNNTRFYLRHEFRKIVARRRLEFIWDIASLFENPESAGHQINLARAAFLEDAPDVYANVVEGITRKKD